jgi:hypothetical protein
MKFKNRPFPILLNKKALGMTAIVIITWEYQFLTILALDCSLEPSVTSAHFKVVNHKNDLLMNIVTYFRSRKIQHLRSFRFVA